MNVYELKTIFDSRASFYRKAMVEVDNSLLRLYSYETLVATIDTNANTLRVVNTQSVTTRRHIREFARQNGFCPQKITIGIFSK